jgi:hypothetical protein
MKNLSIIRLLPMLILLFTFISCEKDAGEGGNSSIYGKVWVRDYNANFTLLMYSYYGQDEDVFIVYGDNKSYSDKVSTNYDGTFEFKYLRPGKYTLYSYSKDSTLVSSALIPTIKEIEITDNSQDVDAGTIDILK